MDLEHNQNQLPVNQEPPTLPRAPRAKSQRVSSGQGRILLQSQQSNTEVQVIRKRKARGQSNTEVQVIRKRKARGRARKPTHLEQTELPDNQQPPTLPRAKRQRVSSRQGQILLQCQKSNAEVQVIRKRKARGPACKPTPNPAALIGGTIPTEPMKLELAPTCSKCDAKKFEFEPLHFCCGNGSIKLAPTEYPLELCRLFTSSDEDAKHFRIYSRLYNNLFAFSSIGGEIDTEKDRGIYVFKLQGQIYHYVPNLLPGTNTPKYLQLYFYDGQHEAQNRTDCFDNVRQDVVDILMNISEKNPYAKFFRSLRELEVTEETEIHINKYAVPDQRTHNAPTSDDVAVIWTESSSSSESSSPHIVVAGKSDKSHRIMHYFGCYDPLQYPVMAPGGESGWSQGILKINGARRGHGSNQTGTIDPATVQTAEELLAEEAIRASGIYKDISEKHVSCREYYCYKLQNRPQNMLLRAGRCFQQYIVDMYVKIENTRLDFFRNNQKAIRADLYQGILDTVHGGENNAANVGHRVILPPSFLGGPRDLKRRYLNAMALVNRYGKPDLFVTMTCNPNWAEIKAELEPGEIVQNRPDLVTRVFRAKLLALKKEIMTKHAFGEVAAEIYVVEFQKRGLPHAHFLIILKPAFKIKSPSEFDNYVCAEMPPPNSVYLRSRVIKHMMHGPCGLLNPQCPCMRNHNKVGKCRSNYPKAFTNDTAYTGGGYPLYRRRDNGDNETVRKVPLDNRWVIPYNPFLLAMFDCHINVEVCSTIAAVKYLYKYVYKGHDQISFHVSQSGQPTIYDEIQQYQSGRWVSPCEAAWRIFEFDLFEMHPPVMALQVHLPNMQTIQMNANEDLEAIIRNEKRSRTPLTEFFKVNQDEGGTGYLYAEFTEHYRWCTKVKSWLKRKTRAIVVGRLTFVAPAEGERYFLRLLLMHRRSPVSYDDLRTVDGQQCATFQDAALKLRLLEEDNAVELCMEEACQVAMPKAFRRLFVTVLIFCQPRSPKTLWEKYFTELSSDFHHQFPGETAKVLRQTVGAVEQYLEAMGKSLAYFGLQHLTELDDDEIRRTRDIVDALDAPVPQQCIDCRSNLNTAQQAAFDVIIAHVKAGTPGAFFIDGPGGTGKTYLYNALYAEVRLMNKIVLPTATSGIAASNIPSGRTAHSRFKIPLDPTISMACDVPKQGSLAALIKETSLIIWDEASMARKENIESVDLLLRDLCDPNTLFGGKLIVFGGDFRQVLPVLPKKSVRETVAASLVNSHIWGQLQRFTLTENIRAREDPGFSAFLLALGNGALQTQDNEFVQLPENIVKTAEQFEDPVDELTTLMFPEITMQSFSPTIFTTRAILTPMNEDVDYINTVLISKFPGDATIYKSFDTVLDDNCNIYPCEFINKLCPGGMSPHELVLKRDCPVILLRNILPAAGLCNGTRLICKRFYKNLIECVITTGHHSGEHVFIPRIKLCPPASVQFPFQFQRKQFPIKLSFAMTINKSQGQTLGQVAIYLPKPVFSPGQLYVALSRARQAKNVTVISNSQKQQAPSYYVLNIVSYDVLRRAGILE